MPSRISCAIRSRAATAAWPGGLYALRESAATRKNTPGTRSLVDVLRGIERGVEDRKDHAPVTVQSWLEAVAKDDPDAAKTFEALITKGSAPNLPGDALGPCFRAGSGEYVAFDPGFDLEATRTATDGKVVGVRDEGPPLWRGCAAATWSNRWRPTRTTPEGARAARSSRARARR